jgi:hypothetical protein
MTFKTLFFCAFLCLVAAGAGAQQQGEAVQNNAYAGTLSMVVPPSVTDPFVHLTLREYPDKYFTLMIDEAIKSGLAVPLKENPSSYGLVESTGWRVKFTCQGSSLLITTLDVLERF